MNAEVSFGFIPVVHLPTMAQVGWHWRPEPAQEPDDPTTHPLAVGQQVLADIDARDRPSNRFLTITLHRHDLMTLRCGHADGFGSRINVALRATDVLSDDPSLASVRVLQEMGLGVWLVDDDLSAALRVLGGGTAIDRLVIPVPSAGIDGRAAADLVVRRGLVGMARSLGTPTMMSGVDDDHALLAARRCGVDFASGDRLGPSLATPTIVHLAKRVAFDVVQRPEHELERLQAVYDAQVLDTPPEALFDDLTRQAAAAFDAPISLVSIVDADRQWFKSRRGLDVSETSREVAFCAHTICEPEVMIVPDAACDARFSRNPLVTGEQGFRFYAGAQIRTSDGLTLGTLCVIDRVPREPTREQILVLERLAQVASIALELRARIHRSAVAAMPPATGG